MSSERIRSNRSSLPAINKTSFSRIDSSFAGKIIGSFPLRRAITETPYLSLVPPRPDSSIVFPTTFVGGLTLLIPNFDATDN